MGYPHAEVSSEGPGSVLIHDDIQMDQQWRKVQPLLADIPGYCTGRLVTLISLRG